MERFLAYSGRFWRQITKFFKALIFVAEKNRYERTAESVKFTLKVTENFYIDSQHIRFQIFWDKIWGFRPYFST
jgi:hypothetical protein